MFMFVVRLVNLVSWLLGVCIDRLFVCICVMVVCIDCSCCFSRLESLMVSLIIVSLVRNSIGRMMLKLF